MWPCRRKPIQNLPCIDGEPHGPWTKWLTIRLDGAPAHFDTLYKRDCTRCGLTFEAIR